MEWIYANSWWLTPLIVAVGNEIVKWTPTEKDNDIWKAISYFLTRVFVSKNRVKGDGKAEFGIYEEGRKPQFIETLDKALFDPYEKRIKKVLTKRKSK